ncbi:hypothetical protein RJ640_026237 [Escallonia rubra]|uniref:Probable zinc-ribbon domain-containing protein n=1 Tax=Escallonia rubra TaxID=112253 RepID=A0AA88UEZ4_9ASTE|nr:hypothetical protein RJ640_026237 [Escallonia rubra]
MEWSARGGESGGERERAVPSISAQLYIYVYGSARASDILSCVIFAYPDPQIRLSESEEYAKVRKNQSQDLGSRIHEADSSQNNEVEHVSEEREASILNQRATIPSIEEPALHKSIGRDNKREDLGDEFRSSIELTSHEDADSSPEVRANIAPDGDNGPLNPYEIRDHCDSRDGKRERVDVELDSSAELTSHEDADSSPEVRANIAPDRDNGPLDPYGIRDHCDSRDSKRERVDVELDSSAELTSHEDAESSPEARAHMALDEDNGPLDQDKISDQNDFGRNSREHPGDINFSDEVLPSKLNQNKSSSSSPGAGAYENEESPTWSPEAEVHENEELSLSPGAAALENESCSPGGGADGKSSLSFSPKAGAHVIKLSSFSAGARPNEIEDSSSLSSGEGNESKDSSNNRDENEFEDYTIERPGNMDLSNEVSSSRELPRLEIEEPSQVAGGDTEVYEGLSSRFIHRISSAENLECPGPKDTITSTHRTLGGRVSAENVVHPYKEERKQSQSNTDLRGIRPKDSITTAGSFGESILSEDLMSPYKQGMKPSQSIQGFNRISSEDTLANSLRNNPSSKSHVAVEAMTKSPTTRSYYAYDGSASSCNETDDPVSDQHFHRLKRNFKNADFVSTKGLPKRDGFMVNSESEMQYRAINSLSTLPGKNHHATKGRHVFPESTRHGFPVRSTMRRGTIEHVSKLPFSQAGHRSGSPSSYGRNEFHTSRHSPGRPEYVDSDKMELLRMVYELQDQLDRTYVSEGKTSERVSPRLAHLAAERERYRDLNYARAPERYSEGVSWSQQSKYPPRKAFSGETSHCRRSADCPCLRCYPHVWHCSAQLPPHVTSCEKEHHMGHPGHNYYSAYCSGSSSPRHYAGSAFSLWSRDAKADDQRLKDREVKKLYASEKCHLKRQHLRPIAGGAPIVTCYRCLELLQLPADFLVFKRRCHRLKCGACSEVLKFSFQNSSVVPYIPDAIAPPPSEVDDYTDTTKNRNFASASRVHAEPVSCSDDFGQSFCISCSTEDDPSPPFHTLGRNANDRKMSSGSSFDPIDERKTAYPHGYQNKYKAPVKRFDSASASSVMSKKERVSSEIEELPPTGSPLHRLMGYSSPSKVIRRSDE